MHRRLTDSICACSEVRGLNSSNAPRDETQDPQLTSPTLLQRARDGDQRGWERLVWLYGPLVYNWCRRAGLSNEDSGDISQEVFATLATKLDQFRKTRPGDSFRRWLKTITVNRARDFHRRNRGMAVARGGTDAYLQLNAQPAGLDGPLIEETEDERHTETNRLLRIATELVRSDFEPKTWQAFWQTVVDGRETADVGADLGISPNAVRVAKSRVRSRLRKEMAELLEDHE